MSRIFGETRQNGYVVRDIEAAMRHWTEKLGIGPFFYFDGVPITNFRYRGEPSDPDLCVALANSGTLQIELIQQRNDAPSMYLDFLRAGHEGLQHMSHWTETMDEDLARIEALGFVVGQSGEIGEHGRFVYYDTETHPGTVMELSETGGDKGALFKLIADEAARWDGSDPIRRITAPDL